ncbi:MAG: lipopolysaccharide transport periplasmic protein LptA [Gammaproteobacteria bacterium]|nr:lipopolysaccharide transport periplasmic protein LptA [Gammaproteobacteria bacterium]
MNRITMLLLLWLATPCLFAAEPPRKTAAPIEIEADSLSFNQANGMSRYHGHVRLKQGIFLFTAEEISVDMGRPDAAGGQKQLQQFTAKGSPVRFARQDATPLQGEAREILFNAATRHVTFNGAARIEQQGDRFEGDLIRYHLDSNRIEAMSSQQENANSRVRVTLQPRNVPAPATDE